MTETSPESAAPDGEVVDLCRDLIRLDTSNYGDGSGPGERKAAEYVAEKLSEVGIEPVVLESEPGRTTVVARLDGAEPARTDALLVHGHLDVVPADAADWTHDPFSGEIADDCIWGRGAIDMKDMDAMILSVVRDRLRTGRPPARPLVLCFLADEEAGGVLGSHWVADHHPELFEDCTEGISEVGGFSLTVRDDLRLYLVETAQKGIEWMRLTVEGTAGHGSMVNHDNAVTELAEAVARLGRYEWPLRLTPTVRYFLDAASEAYGVTLDPNDREQLVRTLGGVAKVIGATLRNTTNPTMLRAGYKHNVIPGRAEAHVDGRFLPGHEAEFRATLDEVLGPRVRRDVLVSDIALETEFTGDLVEAMSAALVAEDPGAMAVPYCLSAGTDAKAFSGLGIRGFGFSPLRLPPGLDFAGMFHGVDERVPIDGLRFGARVLDHFLDLA
ncbi:MAG TPA: M20/M25/M40 family metallo-hydrolase [Jiangellaceae bacterium]|nr:M20/M25/M40 family metallo-hydrolase [Jiangellaceae bacterium]